MRLFAAAELPVELIEALEHLAADVREQLTREGFSFDAKRFLPHVTLIPRSIYTPKQHWHRLSSGSDCAFGFS